MSLPSVFHVPLHALRILRDGLVAAIAFFGVANIALGCVGAANRNAIWIDGQGTPGWIPAIGVLLLALAILRGNGAGRTTRALGRAAALVLAVLCAWDAVVVLWLLGSGRIAAGTPLSLSLLLSVALATWAVRPTSPPVSGVLRFAAVPAAAFLLVLAHLLTFGASDYRRPADVAVVFGAAVWPDGRPSDALADRTRTACRLYHEGYVDRLVLSGGRNPDVPVSEPVCMARLARGEGVPASALILDETGVTSQATLDALARLARDEAWERVLLVSHDYHLARLKLLGSEAGLDVFTVPAIQLQPLRQKPVFVLREVAAWGWHFLRTL